MIFEYLAGLAKIVSEGLGTHGDSTRLIAR